MFQFLYSTCACCTYIGMPYAWWLTNVHLCTRCIPYIILLLLSFWRQFECRICVSFGPCIGCLHARTEIAQICKHMQWAQQYYLCVFSLSYRLLMYASRFRAFAYYVAAATLLLLRLSSRKHLTYWVHKISSNTYTHTHTHTPCIEWSVQCTHYTVQSTYTFTHTPFSIYSRKYRSLVSLRYSHK